MAVLLYDAVHTLLFEFRYFELRHVAVDRALQGRGEHALFIVAQFDYLGISHLTSPQLVVRGAAAPRGKADSTRSRRGGHSRGWLWRLR